MRIPRATARSVVRLGRVDRQAGFLTPVGWGVLIVALVTTLLVFAAFASLIGRGNVEVAQTVAEQTANARATLGLQFLLMGTLPDGSAILMAPEPERTESLVAWLQLNVVFAESLERFLAPMQPGDVAIAFSTDVPPVVSVSATARAGKQGQFVRTTVRSAQLAAANVVASGRVFRTDREDPTSEAFTGGVLPLAVDRSSFASAAAGPIALRFGDNAYAISALGDEEPNEALLRSAAEFLGYRGFPGQRGTEAVGGTAPPAFSVGQRVQLVAVETKPDADAADEAADETRVEEEQEDLGQTLLALLEQRPVIVPIVDQHVVSGFAVASLQAHEDGLGLALAPAAVSPLARFDAALPVPAAPAGGVGLAMTYRMPEGLPMLDVDDPMLQLRDGPQTARSADVLGDLEIFG